MIRALVLTLALLAGSAAAQEFTTYKGHGGPIMGLDVTQDGHVLSASFDNSVGVWTGSEPQWLEGHEAAVIVVKAVEGRALLSGGDDFTVRQWLTGMPVSNVVTRHQGKVSDIAVSFVADLVATASWDGSIHANTVVGQSMFNAKMPPTLWESEVLLGHQSNVTSVGFSEQGTLFSGSSDGTLREWTRGDTGWSNRVIVRHGFGINEIVVADGWIAYGAVDGGTRVIDTETGQQIRDFTLDRRPILAMDYHAGTHQLAVGDGHGYIMMIDTQSWRIARDFRAMRKGPVWALAFSNDGEVIHAGGLDDVIYAWPVAFLDRFDPVGGGTRSFLRDADSMPNGERQFMRKCSVCHALDAGPSRKAGPTLHRLFGRRAGTVPDYPYSPILDGSDIIWTEATVDALFDIGPDHYIPGSKMPMQVIAGAQDRADLVTFLKTATKE